MIIDASTWSPVNASGFIVLEGVNGSGKTTQQKFLKELFESAGFTTICTREPGAGPLGASIRQLVLGSPIEIAPVSELLLFEADRAQHVSTIIKPALTQKQIVISDRYYYSSEAFQGFGRGLDLGLVQQLNEIAIQGLRPDLCIILDLDPEVGASRIEKRTAQAGNSAERDRFEESELAFHQRIRHGFLEIAKNCPEPCLIINANQTPEVVWQTIQSIANKILACLQKS